MRDIKFRAFNKAENKMYLSPSEIQNLGSWFDAHLPASLANVDNIIIMQFTGLKDKNGVEIYEGDVVKGAPYDKHKKEISVIEYRYNSFLVKGESFGWEGEDMWDWEDIEVIGNIYQHPELITKKKRNDTRRYNNRILLQEGGLRE